MDELELIAQLGEIFGPGGPRVLRSIGDDAAVVRAGGLAITSVDTMVDGVHFRRGELTPDEIGARALAAALSDLAAMAVAPSEAYLALGVPSGLAAPEILALGAGASALAAQHGVTIAGGDVTRAPALTLSFTVVGWAERPEAIVGRDGARPGDAVVVTGRLGGAGAGLAVVEQRAGLGLSAARRAELRDHYARPQPRFGAARELAALGARAMIDLSDGVASDAERLAHRSGVGIELTLAALPLCDGVAEVAADLGLDPRSFAATAGEDYELCACIPAAAVEVLTGRGIDAAVIGRVLPGPARLSFRDYAGELAGYEHRF